MLRSFRLGNHRSFWHEQELLLMPSYGRERPVVPVTAIYGANASGKSNLLDGFRFMREAVLGSLRRWDPEGGVPRLPYRLDAQAQSCPSTYAAEMVIDSVPYMYGFTVDDDRVREEWLYSYPEKRRRVLFEREGMSVKFGTKVGESKVKLDSLRDLNRENCLFLSVMAQFRVESSVPVYHWFRHSAFVGGRGAWYLRPPDILTQRVAAYLKNGNSYRSRLVDLVSAADVGITDMDVEETEDTRYVHSLEIRLKRANNRQDSSEVARIKQQLEQAYADGPRTNPEIKTVHGDESQPFDMKDESAGTQAWLGLLPEVLDVLDQGRTLMVDEIDTSLHPLLTSRLVGLFQSEQTNPYGAQLILTTHDTSLLNTMAGEEVLERDQVWFIEKDSSGSSELYALSDFKPRKEENTERRYLRGSYGAVPFLDTEDFVSAAKGDR